MKRRRVGGRFRWDTMQSDRASASGGKCEEDSFMKDDIVHPRCGWQYFSRHA
jgi:hypothetical protein